MSDIINQNTEPLFIFDMPDDEVLSQTISVQGEKGERGDPTKLSQLTNDTGFITNAVANLLNYYTKSETYSQTEVDNLLAKSRSIDGEDLNTLIGERIVGYGNNCVNRPTNANGYFINIPHAWDQHKLAYNVQLFINRDDSVIYIRHQTAGTFSEWERVNPDMSLYYTKSETDEIHASSNYYDEITYTKERLLDTDCYFTMIPLEDSNGEQIRPYVAYSDSLSPTEYARENFTSVTINASNSNDSEYTLYPIVIADGVVINDRADTNPNHYYIGITENREFLTFPYNTTSQAMLNAGCVQAYACFGKMVTNGEAVEVSGGSPTEKNPRLALGVQSDGTIIIFACDGRSNESAGLSCADVSQIMIDKGCIDAWSLDGGGSTSLTINGSKINRNIDGDGTIDRPMRYTLNFKKTTVNESVAAAYSKIGEEKQNLIAQILPYLNNLRDSALVPRSINTLNLNSLIGELIIGYGNDCINRPSTQNGYFINIPHTRDDYKMLYNTQIWIDRDYINIYSRQQVNGTFSGWVRINGSNRAWFRADGVTLATTNAYEEVYFNAPTGGSLAIVSDTNTANQAGTAYSGFNVLSKGWVTVRVYLEMTPAASGNKYIRLFKNGSQMEGASAWRFAGVSGEGVTTAYEYMFENSNISDTFKVEVQGSAGDAINKIRVVAEVN